MSPLLKANSIYEGMNSVGLGFGLHELDDLRKEMGSRDLSGVELSSMGKWELGLFQPELEPGQLSSSYDENCQKMQNSSTGYPN